MVKNLSLISNPNLLLGSLKPFTLGELKWSILYSNKWDGRHLGVQWGTEQWPFSALFSPWSLRASSPPPDGASLPSLVWEGYGICPCGRLRGRILQGGHWRGAQFKLADFVRVTFYGNRNLLFPSSWANSHHFPFRGISRAQQSKTAAVKTCPTAGIFPWIHQWIPS